MRSNNSSILGCLNIVLMTSYVGLYPISNTKTPTVIPMEGRRKEGRKKDRKKERKKENP